MNNRIQQIIIGGLTVALGPDIATLVSKDYVDGKIKDVDSLSTAVSTLQTQLDTLIEGGEGVTQALDTFKEIEAFLNAYTNSDSLSNLLTALKQEIEVKIPTDNASLSNGAGYITDEALTGYAKSNEIPTKTSDLTNDSGFITSTTANATYAKTGDLPTNVSDLNNDAGFITSSALNGYIPMKFVSSVSEATDESVLYFILD